MEMDMGQIAFDMLNEKQRHTLNRMLYEKLLEGVENIDVSEILENHIKDSLQNADICIDEDEISETLTDAAVNAIKKQFNLN
jgi:hypothetical protein